MVFKLVVKPVVTFDIEEAVNYYDRKVAGLGHRFYSHLLSSLTDIQNKPFTYSYVAGAVRRCRIENFPYKSISLLMMSSSF